MENNQEKKEYTLIEKEDEIQLNEEDLKKIAGAYYDDDEGPECPYCGSHHTSCFNVASLSGVFIPRISSDAMTVEDSSDETDRLNRFFLFSQTAHHERFLCAERETPQAVFSHIP